MISDFITTVRGLCNLCCKSKREVTEDGASKEVGAEEGVVKEGAKDDVKDEDDIKGAGMG